MISSIIIVLVAFGVSYGGCIAARRLNWPPWILAFLPFGLLPLLWALGSAYIFSPLCPNIDTCDSGGWLAFSVGLVFIWVLAFIGNTIGVWLFLSRKK